MSKAEQLIACLEGEIAKRDEELAACRVSVENCDLFRARIVELEAEVRRWVIRIQQRGLEMDDLSEELKVAHTNISGLDDLVLSLQCKVIERDAELAAIKAQEPVAEVKHGPLDSSGWPEFVRVKTIGDFDLENLPNGMKLYAAPVSEAKAQGVVMQATDGGRNPRYEGLFDGETEEQRASRLNATPVQQVSVPDVSAMARILADRNADACNVNREDNWAIYGQDYIDDVTAMLAAAPAAPAADAPPENCRQRLAAEGKPYPRSSCTVCGKFSPKWRECDAAIASHRAKGVV